tara:strand:- start:249 stop:365 length:117 start_codon:yes stop_codon:yes gene_type:complete
VNEKDAKEEERGSNLTAFLYIPTEDRVIEKSIQPQKRG